MAGKRQDRDGRGGGTAVLDGFDAKAAIETIIGNEQLTILFQPIARSADSEIFGFEALARGPADSPLHSPLHLFEAAHALGRLVELETLCWRMAYSRFMELDLPGRLFLNTSPLTLEQPGAPPAEVLMSLNPAAFRPDRVVIEVTEQHPIDDYKAFQTALARYKALDFQVAIDDLGAGYSGLRLWSELRPDFVKVDRHFLEGIDENPVKQEFLRSIQDIAHGTKCRVVAEGVETAAEYSTVKRLKVDLMQGFYIARPAARPPRTLPQERFGKPTPPPANPRLSETISILASSVTPIPPEMPLNEVVERLKEEAGLHTLPVIVEGRPIGIVRRQRIMELYLRQFGRELYGRRPVSRFMEHDPIMVEHDLPVERVSRKITDRLNFELEYDFVITRNGGYLGLGRVRDLLKTITQLQIRNARYANPLTLLPGNVPINECIDRLIEQNSEFVVCYCDLDNFKPYNDKYGYSKGDDIIRKTAQVLSAHVDDGRDFLGHIGGDDFILVFTSEDWEERCQHILRHFTRDLVEFYSPEDWAQAGIWSHDRQGHPRFFPLLSLSIGAALPDPRRCRSHHDVASLASDAKHMAKRRAGNALSINRRRGPEGLSAEALPREAWTAEQPLPQLN